VIQSNNSLSGAPPQANFSEDQISGKHSLVLRFSFTKFQLSEFQDAFSLFDNRGDGKINVSQLGDVLRALGQNPTEGEVKKCSSQLKPGLLVAVLFVYLKFPFL